MHLSKGIISLLLLIASNGILLGQQDAQYTQYMYNTLAINPAYAGSRGVLSLAGLHRSQWVGLDGAPTTQTININAPIARRVGLGFSVVNDEIGNGTNQDTYFDAAFSYTLPVSNSGKLSFGLKAGGHILSVDFNKLVNYDASALISPPANIDRKFSPNFGAGIYYRTETFYAGLSVPNFLETEHFDSSGLSGAETFLAQERMNWYLISGYVFDLNPDWKFKPAVLFKAVNGAPLQADFSGSFLLREKFSFGLAYRWSAAISALFGIQITDQVLLGIGYDKETTDLGNTTFNDGSFEIFLRYELLGQRSGVLSPRFF